MSETGGNALKNFLSGLNAHLRTRSQQPVFGPEEVRLKIVRGNGFAKNLMRLCNKTMIGINRIHISRGKVFAGLAGIGLGLLYSECDDALLSFFRSYRPALKEAIIKNVLQSSEVKEALNRTLLQNVYTNKEVQYSLHEVLDWKAIRPQMDSLFLLSKEGLLAALKDPHTLSGISKATAQAVTTNSALIGESILDYFSGTQLTGIVVGQIRDFFRSETFYELLAREVTVNLRGGLSNMENREALYHFTRENFLNW